MTLFVASLTLALTVSFLCSLMEAALLSLTPSQVAELSEKHPGVGAIWQRFKTDIERPIAVILILNTTAHTIGASVAGAQFDELFGDNWLWAFSLLFTFAMLQYTEILPKTLGVAFNRRVAVLIARPLAVAVRTLTPMINLLHLLNRPFERRGTEERRPATLEEIASLAAMARHAKDIGVHQERIIRGAAKLSQMRVSQVMIPIEQVSMLSTQQTLAEAIIAAHIDAHTRFPVCLESDRCRIVGYVNFKEMIYFMRTNPNEPNLLGIIRPVKFVGPQMTASDLLKIFIDQHEHVAIVRSETERSLGLVTLEDLIEELVGELQDEFDRLPRHVHALSGGTWMFGGGVSLGEVATRLNATLPTGAGTLAAWLESQLGEQGLKPGQIVRVGQTEIVVRRVRRGRVFEASAMAVRSDLSA